MVNATEILVCLKINVLEKSEVFLNTLEREFCRKVYNYITHVYSTYLFRVNIFCLFISTSHRAISKNNVKLHCWVLIQGNNKGLFKVIPIHLTSICKKPILRGAH